MKTKKIFTIAISLFLVSSIFGNNVQVGTATLKNQDLDNQTYVIEFDISWENSWRTTSTDPYNWDAVWVFAKYKVGDDGVWKHVKLDNTMANHTITTDNGVAGTIKPSSDSLGVFMFRSADGSGSINWDDVNLLWDYSSDTTIGSDYVQVKVFALEMVYIPEGPFYVGDSAVSNPFGQFMRLCKASDDTLFATPFQISSEDEILLGGVNELNIGRDTNENPSGFNSAPLDDFSPEQIQSLPDFFPKGFNSFYIMKYELSQKAWVDFLNSLTRAQQNARTETDISGTSITNRYVMTNTSAIKIESVGTILNPNPQLINSRNGIKCDNTLPALGPVTFYCDLNNNDVYNEPDDGLWLPVNYVEGGIGILAYLDWSGLRPMSELELVKSARGSLYPVPNEYAWGTSTFTRSLSTTNDNQIDEINSTSGANCNFVPYTGNDNVFKHLRTGIFATSTSAREDAGASYYGVMDLSGNLDEYAMTIGNSNGRQLSRLEHGDGYLTASGTENVNSWSSAGICKRFNGFVNYYVFNRISNRYNANRTVLYRYINVGVRGGRTNM